MTEMVVTVALIGTLLSFAVPRYTSVAEEMQGERNIANMQTIREAFFNTFIECINKKVALLTSRLSLEMKTVQWMIYGLLNLWIQPRCIL